MSFGPSSLSALLTHPFDTVIDVRSPAEYAEDHLPSAINLPALSNAERAEVGTIYVQESAFRARKIGAAMVARNVAAHLEGPLSGLEGGWQPLVYCWRGGQRSNSVATILRAVGWRTELLEGGYRSYRRSVVSLLHDTPLAYRLVLLDGFTGTAKTDILAHVGARGGHVLDLEGLANHRGSVLGPRSGGQPSQKAFETAIAAALTPLDPDRPVLVEAESSKVGARLVPPSLWAAMRAAPRIRISAPIAARASYLARAYADLVADPTALAARLSLLVPIQGGERVNDWIALAEAGAHEDLARALIETHYDPRYAKSRGRMETRIAAEIEAPSLDERGVAAAAAEVADRLSVM